MIPKIIHYCWFGRGALPDLAQKCISSWAKYLPDYKIMLWNEDNFHLSKYSYTEEAYRERKFAFVTDVCRLYALVNYGGIYLDSDVEILKALDDDILSNHAFSGFEDNNLLPTGIMGSVKNSEWARDMLAYYNDKSFYLEDGTIDLTPNTEVITGMMRKKGMPIRNSYQNLEGYCTMYPSDFFCPKSWKTKEIKITENTYCIHHFAGSWLNKKEPSRLFKTFTTLFGGSITHKMATLFHKIIN